MSGSERRPIRWFRFLRLISASAALLATFSGAAIAADLCIVPVRNGEPTDADVRQTFRMVGNFTTFPGSNRAVIPAFNRRGVWTIDRDRAYVPYGGDFPSWGADAQYAFDLRNNRIIGINGRGVFVADAADGVFRPIGNANPDNTLWFTTIAHIDRTGQVLIGSNQGLKVLVGNTVRPIDGGGPDASAGIFRIFDLPRAGGVALVTEDQRILIHSDEGATTETYVLERHRQTPSVALGDTVREVAEFPSARDLLIRSNHETIVMRLRNGPRGIEADQVRSLQYFPSVRGYDGSIDLLSEATNSYVVYGRLPDGKTMRSDLDYRTRTDVRRFERLQGVSFVHVPG